MAKVKPIPDGYHNVTPYLIVDGAAKAIDFYKKVFGATEKMRMPGPGGKVGHAELTLGDSMIMLADEHPDMGHRGPHAYGGLGGEPHGLRARCGRHREDRDRRRARRWSGRWRTSSTATGWGPSRIRSATVVRRHPRRGRAAGGDGEAGGRRHGEEELARLRARSRKRCAVAKAAAHPPRRWTPPRVRRSSIHHAGTERTAMDLLTGKVAIITGASKGIGRVMSRLSRARARR